MRSSESDRRLAAAILCVAGLELLSWLAATVSARLSGQAAPAFKLTAPFMAWADPGDPGAAWGSPVGPIWLYWSLTLALLTAPVVLAGLVARRVRPTRAATAAPLAGTASRTEAAKAAGGRQLVRRGSSLRPAVASPQVTDLGVWLGRCRGVDCHASVEDSIVVLGPPRSSKGLHLVIPCIVDAPGAVLTTSTRPDNLAATLGARRRLGPVAVFDPQGLAPGVASSARWSPIRGCEDPHTAMVRAKALAAGSAAGTTDANFWQASAELAVRGLLHAAALGERSSQDLYRWSLSAVQAREAVMILGSNTGAALSWHQGLESIVTADQRQRDSVWAMVSIAFAALADPKVMDAVSPGPGEDFDPRAFLRDRGTVYLVGTSTGAAATAGLVGAFVEDVVEAARRVAAASPSARLDAPLSLVLDEAANYPLPSLPSLMSEGGGTGISTTVVL